jgi:hypothetical protein
MRPQVKSFKGLKSLYNNKIYGEDWVYRILRDAKIKLFLDTSWGPLPRETEHQIVRVLGRGFKDVYGCMQEYIHIVYANKKGHFTKRCHQTSLTKKDFYNKSWII